MPAIGQFLEKARAHVTGRSDEGNFHYDLHFGISMTLDIDRRLHAASLVPVCRICRKRLAMCDNALGA
jgi:hypothetical protein